MKGILYIVATPIGNLEDITLRAINILSDVDIILAEDTRVTKKLLNLLSTIYDLPSTNLISYHHHSSESKKYEILKMLMDGKNLALVTDAGTPGISDPGNELVEFLMNCDSSIQIVPIPGASSLTTALSVCGFNVSHFTFVGFLPKKKKGRVVDEVKASGYPFVFFESPHRILKTLEWLKVEFGEEKRIFVARELTKLHEETYRGSVADVLTQMSISDPRGEVVVVVEMK